VRCFPLEKHWKDAPMRRYRRVGPRALALAVAALLVLLTPSLAPAELIISLSFAGGTAPALPGGGNLDDIVRTAASAWERVFADPSDTWHLQLTYGWEGQGSFGSLGREELLAQGGTPNRETQGAIWFNNNPAQKWFADPTPWNNSAYTQFTPTSSDLGAGDVNVGRVFTGGVGPAADGFDLLTVAAHEIGHALGLDINNTAFGESIPDGLHVLVTPPRPFAGSLIQLAYPFSAHLNDATALMYANQEPGVRRLISAEDALADAQISQFSGDVNLDPNAVPEPGSLGLMVCGALSAACWRWAKRKRRG
jgi:hypothetical protein